MGARKVKVDSRSVYIILIILLIFTLFIVPKEVSLDDKEIHSTNVSMKEDGTAHIETLIKYEKRIEKNKEINIEIPEKFDARNISVYGKNLFEEKKLHTIIDRQTVKFTKNIKYGEYIVKYDTGIIVEKIGDEYILRYPILENEKIWTNLLEYSIEFPENLDKSKLRAYTFGLPKNSLKATRNRVRLVSYNNPANIKQEIYLVFGKEQILGRFSESIKNAKNIIYNDLVTKEEEGFLEYLNKKKEREYFATILRKYLVASMYLVLCIPIIKYLIIILNVINSKLRIRGKEVKEKVNVGYLDNLDLVKAFNILGKRFGKDKVDTKNLVAAAITKLEQLKFITLSKDKIKVRKKTEKQLSILGNIEKYILDLINQKDKEKNGEVSYSEIEEFFRIESEHLIKNLEYEFKNKEKELEKDGMYSKKVERVEFRLILWQIPLLFVFALVGYINWIIAILIFVFTYTIAKSVVSINNIVYTRKGLRLRKNLEGYEKYLISLDNIMKNERRLVFVGEKEKRKLRISDIRNFEIKTIPYRIQNFFNRLLPFLDFEEDVKYLKKKEIKDTIFSQFFGIKVFKEKKQEKIDSLTNALTFYIDILRIK
jgi:hypothetical protein